jgi:hypothetical protein
MRRPALLLALLVSLAAPVAGAQAKPLVGIGDQKPNMFSDPRLTWLNITKVRTVVSWRVNEKGYYERDYVDRWLKGARAVGATPLVGFGHAWAGSKRRVLPSVKLYTQVVKEFHRRYPWVTDFIAWNEANHCSQPTCHKPERAAEYYDAFVKVCPKCNILGASVIDQPNMVPWVRAFERKARHKVKIWGLHNYLDVNRLRDTGTKKLLKAVRVPIWITETGGIVRRKHYKNQVTGFEESEPHAAKAVKYVLDLATRQPRLQRVYIYQWNTDSHENGWDSGIIGSLGERRKAFDVIARFRGLDPNKAIFFWPPPPPSPAAPAPAPQPAPEPSPPPAEPAPPPAEPCLLGVLCPPPSR